MARIDSRKTSVCELGQQVLAHQDDRHENEKPEKAILAQGRQQLAHPSSVSE